MTQRMFKFFVPLNIINSIFYFIFSSVFQENICHLIVRKQFLIAKIEKCLFICNKMIKKVTFYFLFVLTLAANGGDNEGFLDIDNLLELIFGTEEDFYGHRDLSSITQTLHR